MQEIQSRIQEFLSKNEELTTETAEVLIKDLELLMAEFASQMAHQVLGDAQQGAGSHDPATEEELQTIIAALHKIPIATLTQWSDRDVDTICSGEVGEVLAEYGWITGYNELSTALDALYNRGPYLK